MHTLWSKDKKLYENLKVMNQNVDFIEFCSIGDFFFF